MTYNRLWVSIVFKKAIFMGTETFPLTYLPVKVILITFKIHRYFLRGLKISLSLRFLFQRKVFMDGRRRVPSILFSVSDYFLEKYLAVEIGLIPK